MRVKCSGGVARIGVNLLDASHSSVPASSIGLPEFSRPQRPGDLTPALEVLLAGRTLTAEQTAAAFEAMMSGQSHHGEIGAFLALLAARTPTSDEILGAARIMRQHVDKVECPPGIDRSDVVDT